MVDNAANRISKNKIATKIFSNPFYTAVLIAIVIFLIIIFVFRNVEIDEESESLSRLAFRASIYGLIILTGIQFIQNYYLLNEVKRDDKSEIISQAFDDNRVNSERIKKIESSDGSVSSSTGSGSRGNPEVVDFNLSFL